MAAVLYLAANSNDVTRRAVRTSHTGAFHRVKVVDGRLRTLCGHDVENIAWIAPDDRASCGTCVRRVAK